MDRIYSGLRKNWCQLKFIVFHHRKAKINETKLTVDWHYIKGSTSIFDDQLQAWSVSDKCPEDHQMHILFLFNEYYLWMMLTLYFVWWWYSWMNFGRQCLLDAQVNLRVKTWVFSEILLKLRFCLFGWITFKHHFPSHLQNSLVLDVRNMVICGISTE